MCPYILFYGLSCNIRFAVEAHFYLYILNNRTEKKYILKMHGTIINISPFRH